MFYNREHDQGMGTCWIQEMTDADAYMALILTNIQGELHPLEEGRHTLESGLTIRDYAEKTGKTKGAIQGRRDAAQVSSSCTYISTKDLQDAWRALAEIHPAPHWLWPALVTHLLADHWVQGSGIPRIVPAMHS